jgi:hypothetical protein
MDTEAPKHLLVTQRTTMQYTSYTGYIYLQTVPRAPHASAPVDAQSPSEASHAYFLVFTRRFVALVHIRPPLASPTRLLPKHRRSAHHLSARQCPVPLPCVVALASPPPPP